MCARDSMPTHHTVISEATYPRRSRGASHAVAKVRCGPATVSLRVSSLGKNSQACQIKSKILKRELGTTIKHHGHGLENERKREKEHIYIFLLILHWIAVTVGDG